MYLCISWSQRQSDDGWQLAGLALPQCQTEPTAMERFVRGHVSTALTHLLLLLALMLLLFDSSGGTRSKEMDGCLPERHRADAEGDLRSKKLDK